MPNSLSDSPPAAPRAKLPSVNPCPYKSLPSRRSTSPTVTVPLHSRTRSVPARSGNAGQTAGGAAREMVTGALVSPETPPASSTKPTRTLICRPTSAPTGT